MTRRMPKNFRPPPCPDRHRQCSALATSDSNLKPMVVSSISISSAPFNTPASIDLVEGGAMREGRSQTSLSEGLAGVRGC